MTINVSDPTDLYDHAVTGNNGGKLGKVTQVYIDNASNRPEWAAVTSGLFGSHVALVPLARAEFDREQGLRVPYDKERLQSAPHFDPERELSTEDEKRLFEHYGVPYEGETVTASESGDTGERSTGQSAGGGAAGIASGTQASAGAGTATGAGHDVSGPDTDDAMTRSEERLQVGTETVETGRVRLRKHVVTEEQTVTVPTTREEVVIEREPVTEQNAGAAHDGPSISEEEHEVTLHAERPVVSKETEAVERVRLGTRTVQDQDVVSGEVRREEIEVDDEDRPRS